jgi:hypothetical protein
MISRVMWYYSKNGIQLGPVSREELSAKATGGEVSPSDLIWKEGMPDWIPLGQAEEFGPSGVRSVTPPQIPQGAMGSVPVPQPAAYPGKYVGPQIPNYLWQSIVVTVMCCLPFGVVAIVYSAKVDTLVAQDDIAGAMAASNSAKTWATVGAIIGAILTIGMLGLMALGAANS